MAKNSMGELNDFNLNNQNLVYLNKISSNNYT